MALYREIKVKEYEKKLTAYLELMGLKIPLIQNYVSRFEASVFSDYHEYCWKMFGCPLDSFDVDETKRPMKRSEDLVFEISKIHQQLFEKLALIKILFAQKKELDLLVLKLYNFKTLKITSPDTSMDFNQLNAHKNIAVSAILELVKKNMETVMIRYYII